MASNRTQLTMDLLARVRGVQDVERLAGAIDDTGDEMGGAAADAALLERAIDQVEDEIRDLNRELLRTGDIDVFDKIRRDRSTLAQLRRMRQELGEIGRISGRDAGSEFTRGFGGTLGAIPAQLKGALIVGAAGAATVVAPLLGGTIAAAVLGGVGIGGIAGGIAAAARDQAVQDAAKDLLQTLSEPFDELGQAFVAPTVVALREIADAGADVLSDLQPQLEALAPLVGDLGRAVGDMLRSLGPGIKAALEAAQPIIDVIADRLPDLGSAISFMFELIAGGSEGAASALGTIFDIIEATVVTVGLFVRGLTEAFEIIVNIAKSIPVIKDLMAGVENTSGGVVTVLGHMLAGFAGGADAAVAASSTIISAFQQESEEIESTNSNLQRHHDLIRAQADPLFALIQAQQRLRDKQHALNQAIEEHGRNSREARDAELDLAESAVDLQGAVADAAGVMRNGLTPELRASLEAAGLTEKQIGRLEDRFEDARKAGDKFARTYTARVNVHTKVTGPASAVITSGNAQFFQHGGQVMGPAGLDRVPAMLTAGEFVVRREAAQRHLDLLRAINSTGAVGGVRPMAAAASGGDGAAAAATHLSVNVFTQGSILSERDLVGIIRDEMLTGGLRDALRVAMQGVGV